MRACRRIQRARGHSQTGEVPGFVRRLRSPPFWQRSDVLYGGAHSYKAKYYGTHCGGLHFGHFRARRTARAPMRSARVNHPCARHHSYGQADRRRPRPLTPCGPDSKRSPAARCLRTVGALSASVQKYCEAGPKFSNSRYANLTYARAIHNCLGGVGEFVSKTRQRKGGSLGRIFLRTPETPLNVLHAS